MARCDRRQNQIRADVRVVGLPGLAPLRAPQSPRREDDGEERGYAERDKRPDEEEGPAGGLGDLGAHASPLHVDDGMPNPRSDPRRMMTYPDRRSASTSVPYSQTTRMGTATRFEIPPFSIPRMMSPVR